MIPAATASAATQILRALVGRDDAVFHDGQLEAISAIVDERRRVLVVQRTGWGKSAVYFIASLMLRARGAGPTILISPLLALMRDQVEAASRAGVRAVSMSSANAHEWASIREQLAAEGLYVEPTSAVCWAAWSKVPERLRNGDVVIPLCGAGLKAPV